MHEISVNDFQKRALAIATGIAVIFGAYFLWGYFLLIVFAAIVAFSFNPLYQKILKKWGKPGLAVTLTLIASFLTLIIPLLVVLSITAYEIATLIDKVAGIDLGSLELAAIDKINSTLQQLNISFVLTEDWIKENSQNAISTVGSVALAGLATFLGNFFSFFTTAIIYIFVFISLLLKQDRILSTIQELNPLGKSVGELYKSRVTAMTKGTVQGQFTIAFAQGATAAALLYFAGLQDFFFFFLVVLTALSVIPLGAGIVMIPIGVAMILTGNIWGGLLAIGGHLLVVTNIDNVLRPKLVPKKARLDSALMLLAVFSGINFFGFLGIVIGPVIMILIVTTVQVYLEVYRNIDSANNEVETKKSSKGTTKKMYFWKKEESVPEK